MAKFIILCLGIFAASLSNVKALTKEDLAEIEASMVEHVNECNKEFGVSDEVLKAAKEDKNIDAIDPCLIGCVFKKTKVINEKGMFDTEQVMEGSKKYLKSDEDMDKFKDIVKDCSKVNDESVSDGEQGCERAKLLLSCFADHKGDLMVTRR